ncbi:MAG: hypothetical protein AAF642_04650 [Pseudomonadota bacterium]
MTLETAYYITQIIAVLAVVASLVFVGIEIRQGAEQTRQNTRAVKAAASFEAMHSWATFNEMALSWSDEKLATAIATHDPNKTWDDFSPEVQAMMMVFYRALFQKLEGQFYMYQYGTLDKELWEGRRDWAAGVIRLPFFQVLWEQEKGERIWSDKFIAVIEAARDASTVRPLQTYAQQFNRPEPAEA